MWRHSVFRQPITAAQFITKSSKLILLPGFIRSAETEADSGQKVEYLFVSRHIRQTDVGGSFAHKASVIMKGSLCHLR